MNTMIDLERLRSDTSHGSTLPALRHALVEQALARHPEALVRLVDGLGSPLHMVFPQVFTGNVALWRSAFERAGVEAQILFAKKANKADCFARCCARLGIGIDVASLGELEKALAAGVPGDRIGLSGPEKDEHLIGVAISHDCLIAVDSVPELARIIARLPSSGKRARILLRCRPAHDADSRFGLSDAERESALSMCVDSMQAVRLLGFSFHLSGYSVPARAHTTSQMIDACVRARAAGLPECRHVNMGGGFAVQYVAPADWDVFSAADSPQRYHAARRFGGFYPYGTARAGADALAELLDTRVEGALTVADKARRHGIALIAEPGRALLDQAGMTAFRVQGVKDRRASAGYAIVVVQGTSFSLSEQWFNSEYLPDPVLLTTQARAGQSFAACVGGSSCLESDMVSWRKIGFDKEVRPGDILVYLNTAGYQMDSNESPFHEARLPYKAVIEIDDESLRWRLDGLT